MHAVVVFYQKRGPKEALSQPIEAALPSWPLFEGPGRRKQDVQSPATHSCQGEGRSSPVVSLLVVGLRQWLLLSSLLPKVQFGFLISSLRSKKDSYVIAR
jgi:hypothetical protein